MKKAVSRINIALVFAFLYIPIVVLIINSFNSSKSRTVWTGFTTSWYGKLFHNEVIISSFINTLIVAAAASVVSTVIGTVAALAIFRMKKNMRSLTINISYLPIINPEIVTGVSLMLLFVTMGIPKDYFGYLTLILAHISFCVPYVILSVLPKLRQMNVQIYEAALDLGCNPSQAFRKVVIPEIMPGILTGFLMSLTYSVDDFIVSYFTNGTTQTLSITIESMTRRKISPEINALSTIIFVVVLTVLLVMNIIDAQKRKAVGRE